MRGSRNSLLLRSISIAVVFTAFDSISLPAQAPAVDTPLIDIHTHVFNLCYLPVRGILVARGVPKTVAGVLDRLLVGATPLADLTVPADVHLAADIIDVSSMEQSDALQWVLGRLQNAQADRREPLTRKERRALRKYVAAEWTRADLPPGEASDMELVQAALDQARFDPRQDKSYPRFLATLMQDEVTTVRLARKDYPAVDLMIHHLMDMERPYNDRPSLENARQVERLEPLARLFPGQLLGFVAFDPFRREKALPAVRRALDSKRALGVKFYPPSGYRASGNAGWPNKPSWWKLALRGQWNARYRGWHGEDLNRLNREFFSYCAANSIPIIAHCTPQGFEAFESSGELSDPKHWRKVLDEFPKLRLVLAHAGGGASWFSDDPWTGDADFDQRAWDLATRYENVYLDLSYSDEVLNDAKREALRRRLTALLPHAMGRPFALGDKLVYGSDWHMVAALDGRREILSKLRELFADPALAPYRARFFAGNAARFLRLKEFVDDAPLQVAQRDALRALLARIRVAEAAP